jgi:predicted CXXCH cytochrome family protein
LVLAWPWRWLAAYTIRHPKLVPSLVAAVLSLAWGVSSAWQGRHAMHSPGPLALAHEKLDCTVCHTQPWQPLHRLVAADQQKARLIMDQACVTCHADLVHQSQEIPADVPNCVSCHREHQGRHGLTTVADRSCTGCHADLRTVQGPSTQFERSVTSLDTHPELAVLRRGAPDPGTIAFNHAAHLKPEGVLDPDNRLVSLKCADCHQPAPDGRYMEPIRFDAHCARCHASALVYDMARFRDRPAPHGQQPELLRGLLRERYTAFIQQHPEELGIERQVEVPLPGLSGLRAVTKEEWTWANEQLEQADRVLFAGAGGCQYCHRVEGTAKGWHIASPAIPQRWLGFSKFSHYSHRLDPKPVAGQENCTACHDGVRSSTQTADVLLPSIKNCMGCHNRSGLPHSGRSDCTECHTYHNQVGGRGKVRELPRAQTPWVPDYRPDDGFDLGHQALFPSRGGSNKVLSVALASQLPGNTSARAVLDKEPSAVQRCMPFARGSQGPYP